MEGRIVAVLLLGLSAACASGDEGSGRGRDGGGGGRDGGRASDGEVARDGGGCVEGTVVACALSCASMGTAICTGGMLGSCQAPVEECNGADDDCDGNVDEGLADRTCTAACGGGVSHCAGGSYTACMGGTPAPETCDNTDQDCDGNVDEALTRPCTAMCGPGIETCGAGVWGTCVGPAPLAETCDGADQDCDGRVDETLSRACATACGMGMETCATGAWVGCTAPAPLAETCNRMDDDCDTHTDEGFQATVFDPVPMTELTAAQPPCNGPNAGLDVCLTAARRWCHARPSGCYVAGGAGHLTATATTARVVCFGDRGDEHNASFAEVSAASSISVTSANIATRVAESAVNRYCRSLGMGGGVGPTEHGSTDMTVTCLPADIATTVSIPTSDLTTRGCNPIANADTLGCATASDAVCRARGYIAGYGPVEWNSTDSAVLCFQSG